MQPMEYEGPRKSRQFTRFGSRRDRDRRLYADPAVGVHPGALGSGQRAGNLRVDRQEFVHRVGSVYAVTLLVAAASLLLVDKLPLVSDPFVALERTVLASLPGSFLATVVDGLQ